MLSKGEFKNSEAKEEKKGKNLKKKKKEDKFKDSSRVQVDQP